MLSFEKTSFDGLYLVHTKQIGDERGFFSKVHNKDLFEAAGINAAVEEVYFSTSTAGVVRGMHFQTPPYAHSKIVFCLRGAIFDVALDLRKNSPTFGQSFTATLKANEPMGVLVPEGFAHGLQALEDDTMIINACSRGYAPDNEAGIAWDSFGVEWPIADAVVSEKDQNQPSFADYASPFEAQS